MKYSIHHTTVYLYNSLVSVCQNMVMLTPRKSKVLACHSHRLNIVPTPSFSTTHLDAFDNSVMTFTIEETHSMLTIKAVSHVELMDWKVPHVNQCMSVRQMQEMLYNSSDPGWFEAVPFVFDSPRITRSDEFAKFISRIASLDVPVLSVLEQLASLIYREFKYSKEATQVDTPTEVAFQGRAGVCQDFSHIAIACLRSIGIPARYVSGYLRTTPAPGQPRLVGADQSHAWVSAWCGGILGWVDFDPTNDCFCSRNHIPIAWGRDYTDVVPIRGVFLGAGEPVLSVSVDVTSE